MRLFSDRLLDFTWLKNNHAEHWCEYRFEAEIDRQRGQSLSLLARYQDDENFAACTLTDASVRIEERVNGVNRIVATSTPQHPIGRRSFTPAMSVAGNTAMCLIGGAVVAHTNRLNPALQNGAIGLKAWDPVPNQSAIRVRQVHITTAVLDTMAVGGSD